jgi:hypothetical protein
MQSDNNYPNSSLKNDEPALLFIAIIIANIPRLSAFKHQLFPPVKDMSLGVIYYVLCSSCQLFEKN